jgi:hypothetical protein
LSINYRTPAVASIGGRKGSVRSSQIPIGKSTVEAHGSLSRMDDGVGLQLAASPQVTLPETSDLPTAEDVVRGDT